MSDIRLLSDEELRSIRNHWTPGNTTHPYVRALTELIERRAAESEVPFAVGSKVTVDNWEGEWKVEAVELVRLSRVSDRRQADFPASCLTPVPPAPTAVQVFAEALLAIAPTATLMVSRIVADAAFREFCREWNIDADKPLGGDAE